LSVFVLRRNARAEEIIVLPGENGSLVVYHHSLITAQSNFTIGSSLLQDDSQVDTDLVEAEEGQVLLVLEEGSAVVGLTRVVMADLKASIKTLFGNCMDPAVLVNCEVGQGISIDFRELWPQLLVLREVLNLTKDFEFFVELGTCTHELQEDLAARPSDHAVSLALKLLLLPREEGVIFAGDFLGRHVAHFKLAHLVEVNEPVACLRAFVV